MKLTTNIMLALTATAGISNAALVGTNLSFEGSSGNAPITGWTVTSTGSDAIDTNDFRTAPDPDNWYADSTVGTIVLLLESDNANETGTLGQELTGVAEAGTYTWSLLDVGIATFSADGANSSFTYGFSLDGTSFIPGSSVTLTEGTELTEGTGVGGFDTSSVSYTATGGEAALHLLFLQPGNGERSVPSIGSTTLDFTPVPEPSSAALLGLGGLALILRRRK